MTNTPTSGRPSDAVNILSLASAPKRDFDPVQADKDLRASGFAPCPHCGNVRELDAAHPVADEAVGEPVATVCLVGERYAHGHMLELQVQCHAKPAIPFKAGTKLYLHPRPTIAAQAAYDRALIAKMLLRPGDYTVGAIYEQSALIDAADNADAAGVHTAIRLSAAQARVSEEEIEETLTAFYSIDSRKYCLPRGSRRDMRNALESFLAKRIVSKDAIGAQKGGDHHG